MGSAWTISDVALTAGVSTRTVSRVINNSDGVNEQTRREVQAVIDETKYSPSSQARGLVAKRSSLLGLIYDVPSLFINEVQKSIYSVCGDEGYDVVVHPCDFGSDNLLNDVRRFVNRSSVDGLIVLPPISEIRELDALFEEIGVPHVRFSSELSHQPWQVVVTDYVPAVTDMTNYLVRLGHRQVGFISGPRDNIPSQKRQAALVEALAKHRLELNKDILVEGGYTYESGKHAARKLLSKKVRPTAIFAANDEMAFGVMKVAIEMRIGIPADLSVVGFDGTDFTTFISPRLSTICRPTSEMASLATRKLLAMINEGKDAASAFESMVSPHFVPRESIGPAPTRLGSQLLRVGRE